MDVRSLGSVNGTPPVRPTPPAAEAGRPAAAQPISTEDSVEISAAGRLLDSASRASEIRTERLNQIKAEIEAGVYDTADKLEAALVRLLAEAGLRLDSE